jgi:SAM-dependent methyltransferase
MVQAQGVAVGGMTEPVIDRGSFRDPSGFVCHLGGQVFRAVDAVCAETVRALQESGLLAALEQQAGLLHTRAVRTDEPAYENLRGHYPQVESFLWHERVPFISYPYEWTTSMLADAAVRCLDLQLLLVEQGYTLKDASAYNMQFVGGKVVFIDIPSIVRAPRRDMWTALDQFYRMFLYPLLLSRSGRTSLKEYFLSNIDGMEPAEVYRRFGFFGALGASILDLWLPQQLQRFVADEPGALRQRVEQQRSDARPLMMNLRRLRAKVGRFGAAPEPASRWTGYADDNSYDEKAEAAKRDFVDACLEQYRPARVLDIGCNTGRYAEMAAARGASVVAVDSDAGCIDRLYRRARDKGRDILPLVVDLANPSPGIGFRNAERSAFEDRASFDCVLALALVHHLLVTGRLPLEAIRDMFADLAESHLVVEYVDPADPMFISVLGAREDLYGDLTPERFVGVFEKRFKVLSQAAIGPHRIIYFLEKHT